MQTRLKDIHPDVKLIKSSVSQMEGMLMRTNSLVEENDPREQLTVLASNTLQIKAALEAIPSQILGALVNTKPIERQFQTLSSSLGTDDNCRLALEVGKGLIAYPGALAAACENIYPATELRPQAHRLSARPKRHGCGCRPMKRYLLRRRGGFGLSYKFDAEHDLKCQYHWLCNRTSSYSISVQLRPFLRKALEFTFAISHGAGGHSFGPSMRYRGVVKRSQSPAFRLFDHFPRAHGRLDFFANGNLILDESCNADSFAWSWDLDSVREGLLKLRRDLEEIFRCGRAAASDCEESGKTLLHVRLLRMNRFFNSSVS